MLCSGLSQVEVALVLVVFSCDFWIGNCNLLNQKVYSKQRKNSKAKQDLKIKCTKPAVYSTVQKWSI